MYANQDSIMCIVEFVNKLESTIDLKLVLRSHERKSGTALHSGLKACKLSKNMSSKNISDLKLALGPHYLHFK